VSLMKLTTILVLITFFLGLVLVLVSISYEYFMEQELYRWLASLGAFLMGMGTFFAILQEKKFGR
jgi:hypothetical protein